MAQQEEKIIVMVREDGFRVVLRGIQKVAESAEKGADSVDKLDASVKKTKTTADSLAKAVRNAGGGVDALGSDILGLAGASSSAVDSAVKLDQTVRKTTTATEGLAKTVRSAEAGVDALADELSVLATSESAAAQGAVALDQGLRNDTSSARALASSVSSASASVEAFRDDLSGLTLEETKSTTQAVAMRAALGGITGASGGASAAVESMRTDLEGFSLEAEESTASSSRLSRALQRVAGLLGLRKHATMPRASDYENTVKGLNDVDRSARKAAGGLGLVRRGLQILTIGVVVSSLISAADSFTLMGNRIRLVTASTDEAVVVQQRLFEVAQRSRAPFEATGELYSRLAQSTKTLATTQGELLQITETINQAIALSGANAQEASAGMVQFAQGLAAGRLNGDELRSVLEQMPVLADIIAKEFGVTRGELRKLGADGELTSNRILKALREAGPEIEQQFKTTVPTIRQAFTVMNNAWVNYVGNVDRATGTSRIFARVIIGLAGQMDILAAAVITVGAAIAVAFGLSTLRRIQSLVTAFRLLAVTILANPLIALAAVIAAALAALYMFRNEITIMSDGVTTLGDLLSAVFEVGKLVFLELVETIRLLVVPAFRFLMGLIGQVDVSFVDMLKGVAWVVDRMIGLFLGLGRAIVAVFRTIPGALMDMFVTAMNGIVAAVEWTINKLVAGVNKLPGIDLDSVSLGRMDNQWAGGARELGASVRDEFMAGFEQNTFAQLMDAMLMRAQEIGDERRREEERRKSVSLDRRSMGQRQSGDDKARRKLLDDLRALENEMFPVLAAQRQLTDAEDLLNRAIAAGLTTKERSVEIIGRLRERLAEQLDPYGAMIAKLDEERTLLGLSNREREIETELLQATRQLRDQGIDLGEEETNQLRERITAMRDLSEQLRIQQEMLQDIRGPLEEYQTQMSALRDLLESGVISMDEFRAKALELDAAFLQTQTDGISGLRAGILELYREMTNMADLVQSTVVGTFRSMEDALVDLVTKGTLDFRKLADQIVADITRIAIRAAIVGPIVRALFGDTMGMQDGGAAGINLPGFATGGSFVVGGSGATDSHVVAFRATPGERVTVETPEQQRQSGSMAGSPIVMNIYAQDAQSFSASRSQVMTDAHRIMDRARRRNT